MRFRRSFAGLDSPVRRLGAPLKMAMASAGLGATLALPIESWGFFLAWALFLGGVAALGRVPISFLVGRLLALAPLVLCMAGLAWFQPQGGKIFLSLVVKSSLSLVTMMVLSHTTPFAELLRVLRRLRVPALLLTTVALMYRYLSVVVEETQRMRRARASRTFTARRFHTWRVLAAVVGQLFNRSAQRAERIYGAMCARGWK